MPGSTGRLEIMEGLPRGHGVVGGGGVGCNSADKVCWAYAAMQMQLIRDVNIFQILELQGCMELS